MAVDVVRPLRAAVLRAGLPADTAVWPGDDDPEAIHLAAYAPGEGEAPAGVVTLLPAPYPADGAAGYQLRGMAVAETVRGRGVGALLLAAALDALAERRVDLVWCNARVAAAEFYARHGFAADGPEFVMTPLDVVHVRMWRRVAG